MAYLLETLRSQKKVSVHGRMLGIDKDGYLVGPPDIRTQVQDIQTTIATSLAPFGMTRFLTSGSSQNGVHTLQAPVIGVSKQITLDSSSTGCQIVRASGGALFYGCSVTTAGSTVINFLKAGAQVTLQAVSSVAWRVMAMTSLVSSDAFGISFTTST